MSGLKYFVGLFLWLASGIALQLSHVVGPPDTEPKTSAAILSAILLISWTAGFFLFGYRRSNQPDRHKWMRRLGWTAAASGFLYLCLLLGMAFQANDDEWHAKGFIVKESWKKFIDPANQPPPENTDEFRYDPDMSEAEQIRKVMGYVASRKWTEGSILIVDIAMWLVLGVCAVSSTVLTSLMASNLPKERPQQTG